MDRKLQIDQMLTAFDSKQYDDPQELVVVKKRAKFRLRLASAVQ
jgi:hypothetical protein